VLVITWLLQCLSIQAGKGSSKNANVDKCLVARNFPAAGLCLALRAEWKLLEAPAIRPWIFDLARGAIYLSVHSMGYIYVPGSY
jgi:hypothetical protein